MRTTILPDPGPPRDPDCDYFPADYRPIPRIPIAPQLIDPRGHRMWEWMGLVEEIVNEHGPMTLHQFGRRCLECWSSLTRSVRNEALYKLHRMGRVALSLDLSQAGQGRVYVCPIRARARRGSGQG